MAYTNYVLNADFYNLIPEGFHIPDDYYDKRNLEMGLIPVYDGNGRSGVIDQEGSWVVEPQPFNYQVMTPNTV